MPDRPHLSAPPPAPLDLQLRVMTEADARQVAGWRYPEPYGVFALGPEAVPRLLDRERAYYSVVNSEGDLVGFCCFGPEARVDGGEYGTSGLDVAAALRPDLTGFGRGARFAATILTFARGLFGPIVFRVTVPARDARALRVAQQAGFVPAVGFRGSRGRRYVQLLLDRARIG
ncbi:MAG: N-acetyltransferase [Chloroflexi bacterium]|nr:N-acetyltransferase [Chloroflexota bacterium]